VTGHWRASRSVAGEGSGFVDRPSLPNPAADQGAGRRRDRLAGVEGDRFDIRRTLLIDGCGNWSFRAIPHFTIEGVSTV